MKTALTRLLVPVVFVPGKLSFAFLHHTSTKTLVRRWHLTSNSKAPLQDLASISPLEESSSHSRSTRVDLLVDNPFEQCWAADSWSVNAADNEEINMLVRCFNSPAPPAFFALTRALQFSHASKKYEIFQLFTRMLKTGFHFVVRRSRDGDIIEWRIMSQQDRIAALGVEWELVRVMKPFSSAVQISHHLLELATEASERHERLNQTTVDDLVGLAIERLYITLGTESRGRSSADAAFAFAMAGVTEPEIYQILSIISYLEVKRMGPRPSLSSRNILQIVEKLAAAGIRGPDVEPIYELAAKLLLDKEDRPEAATIDSLQAVKGKKTGFGMHSTRALLWLWRFAARQSKAKIPTNQNVGNSPQKKDGNDLSKKVIALDSDDWVTRFGNPQRPLVVDIGCGMGVSMLGLSGYQHLNDASSPLPIDYSQCNFVGGDLKSLVIGYSNGIATRWGVNATTQFVHQSAEGLLDQLQKYPGPVAQIMIQFPTPFRLATKTTEDGNSQLPADATSGFMVTPCLLNKVREIFEDSKNNQLEFQPQLLIQSNCEDVAIAMREMALQAGMVCVQAKSPVVDLPVGNGLPQRTLEWIKTGGERPIGTEWSAEPLLPRFGQTETEVACMFNGIPVHRCLLICPTN